MRQHGFWSVDCSVKVGCKEMLNLASQQSSQPVFLREANAQLIEDKCCEPSKIESNLLVKVDIKRVILYVYYNMAVSMPGLCMSCLISRSSNSPGPFRKEQGHCVQDIPSM